MTKYTAAFYFTILFAFCLNLCYPFYLNADNERHKRQVDIKNCRLPAHPKHGKWIAFGYLDKKLTPGRTVEESTVLSYVCNNGFKKFPDESFINLMCNNSKWIGETPKCLRTCQSLRSTKTMSIKCDLNGTRVNCENPFQETRATYKCLLSKQSSLPQYSYCFSGRWYESVPTC